MIRKLMEGRMFPLTLDGPRPRDAAVAALTISAEGTPVRQGSPLS